ncbi:dicarboxylate/amino acid:cation symporter [Clostridiaceae bacterium M8S5]|nr:dicarboxylate/amino acid:cation symporter [Clostridiaceae bacterium M8S5]
MRKQPIIVKLLIGIIAGILIGMLCKSIDDYRIGRLFVTFTDLFANFLSFIIPCIILAFVVPGIADLGKKSGRMLLITAGIAYLSTICAGLLAYFAGISILPRIIKAANIVEGADIQLKPFFSIEIPPVMGIMTALIMSFMIGLGLAHIKGKTLAGVFDDFQHIIELVVKKALIPFVPVYIIGIFVKLTVSGKIFNTLKSFSSVFVILIALQICYLLIQYTVVWFISRKNPFISLKNMLPAYMMALGTQSSAATIPMTLQSVRNNDVSEDVSSFVVPLCATIHLAGDTIALVLTSMGVMLLNGVDPTLAELLPFIFMLGITMIAAPGIPGGGVYAALGLLQDMLLFTKAQQGIMIALHAAQDSFGTATNITGDGAIAILVDTIAKKRAKK